MSANEGIYTPDVTAILDLFYANEGAEPDWAAIRTRLYGVTDSHYSVIINLLRAMFAIYESPEAYATIMFRLEQELADK